MQAKGMRRRALARAAGRRSWRVAVIAVLLVPAGRLDAQTARATLTGRVLDAVTGAGIPSAQLRVLGTTLGAVTDAQGGFTLRAVPAGSLDVQALRVGYAEQKRTILVPASGTATADFRLQPVSVQLAPVVSTATGEQRRVEVGNNITRIAAAEVVQQQQITSVSDLLTARTAGVQVLPGTSAGAGSRIRIRGANSLSLSNDPIYVIDGIRVTGEMNSSKISQGGTLPSRVTDINPEDIETLEVVRGPSAATLYGTDAANGVIVITTKRGHAGRPRWDVYGEVGAVTDRNDYPTAYSVFGKNAAGAPTTTCFNGTRARGLCTVDSVTRFNLFDDPRTTPVHAAPRQQYGVQVSGGSEQLRYFVGGEWEDEQGRLRMPRVFQDRLEAAGTGVEGDWLHPNAYRRASGRLNLSAALSPTLDLTITTNYVRSGFRQPPNDNNTIGLLSNAFGGPGRRDNVSGGDSLFGYRAFTPDRMFQNVTEQTVDRFIGGTNASWRPTSWLVGRANLGLDVTGRRDLSLCRFDQCVRAFEQDLGFKQDFRASLYQYTVDLGATTTHDLGAHFRGSTTLGAQYFANALSLAGGTASKLPPGGTTLTQGAVQTTTEDHVESRTLGLFGEQQLALADRLFLTVGLRADRNSAFGADFGSAFYPKTSLSWIVSQERFFPAPAWLDQFRLRAAWGASGNQPGTTDAVRYYLGRILTEDGTDQPAVSFGYLGDRHLKPERSEELEGGFDFDAGRGRLHVELTGYHKESRDALVQRVLPPTTGTDSTVVFANIGRVRNQGLEGLVDVRLLARRAFGWDVTLNGSTNANRIIDLGDLPPIIGNTIDQREGFPLNAYWQHRYTYADANQDGVLSRTEVQVDTARSFLGYSQPRHELSVRSGVEGFGRRVRLQALADYKGGFKLYNNTERIRCASRRNCKGLVDPSASLAEQARVIALTETPVQSLAGFIEDASFWRLRELSLSVRAPDEWAARAFGARSMGFVFAARNLGKWTRYSGIDPESNYNTTSDIPSDFQTLAPPTYFTFRLNLGY
jgi:TonB-linked SusC/RagA family outer membrane protein